MSFSDDAPRKVSEKVDQGLLPLERPVKMWAGRGDGRQCDGCDRPVSSAQVEYEIEVNGRTYRLHLGCAFLLEAVRKTRGLTPVE